MDGESGIPGFNSEEFALARIFQPEAFDRTAAALKNNLRFVHYTSADTALKMIQGAEVWMRNASCMNDFMEIEHGHECLRVAYKEHKEKFATIFDGMFPGFCTKLEELYNGWLHHFRFDTYLSCISEHNGDEDSIGRLSMWRAYGGAAGVAIVVKSNPFLMPSDALKAYTRPVRYLDKQGFSGEFSAVLDDIHKNTDGLKEFGEDAVMRLVFDMFMAALLCTKHQGFLEEREWRVTYCPAYEKSDRLKADIQTIAGTPQPIYRIPLKDIPDEGLIGIEIPSLIDRVIVGPTQHPWVVREALVSALERANVADAQNKVIVSDIPLRQ